MILKKSISYRLSLVQSEDKNLVPKGHEVAWDEFVIQKSKQKNKELKEENFNAITISNNKFIELKNSIFSLKINSTTGEIISWVFNGKEITNQPIKPNFWRPPTDNDLGNGMDKWAKNLARCYL